MEYSASLGFLLIIIGIFSVAWAGQAKEIETIQQRIQQAENEADVDLLDDLFTADAVYLNPQGPPVVGRKAIRSLYEFMFRRYQWTSAYENEEIEERGDSVWIRGIYRYRLVPRDGSELQEDKNRFEWLLVKSEAGWKLAHLLYGEKVDPRSRVPALPDPTGKYGVGIRDFYLTDLDRPEICTKDKNDLRKVAFQVWYPAGKMEGQKPRPYQSLKMAEAAAHFLNWPPFANSYNVYVESNSFSNVFAEAASQPYPVILYNHGYGGFTTVHQTVCEELASQGYVVVSVGHAYESALLLKPDGDVKAFDPNNEAYAEDNGRVQERLKDQIVSAENVRVMETSYRKLLAESPLHQESVQIWTADNQFVLRKLQEINKADPILKGMMDLETVGIFGHSLGGATAGEMAITEPSIKAGVNLDGFQFGRLLETELTIPFMFMWENGRSTENTTNGNEIFYQKSKAPCYSLVIKGFEHATFTDLPLFRSIWQSSELNPEGLRAIQLQREYILAFFNKHLKGIPAQLLSGPAENYPEVIFKSK